MTVVLMSTTMISMWMIMISMSMMMISMSMMMILMSMVMILMTPMVDGDGIAHQAAPHHSRTLHASSLSVYHLNSLILR